MIELIFVIVIIGILAAIAIPKFASTSLEAEVSAVKNSTKTYIQTAGGYITKNGTTTASEIVPTPEKGWSVESSSVLCFKAGDGACTAAGAPTATTRGMAVKMTITGRDVNLTIVTAGDYATECNTQKLGDGNYSF
jgi:type II secretory pathway pseudopilin PulG